MKRLLSRLKHPEAGPSLEAIEARATAGEVRARADRIYLDREYLLGKNHLAERIRLIYEGNR